MEASGEVLYIQKKVASLLVFCSIGETGAYVMKGKEMLSHNSLQHQYKCSHILLEPWWSFP